MRGNHVLSRIALDNTLITAAGLVAHLIPVVESRGAAESGDGSLQISIYHTAAGG